MQQKATVRFHEPTVEQLQSEKMDQIFQMLRKQEQGISTLLKKYQNYDDQDLNKVFSKNYSPKNNKNKKQSASRKSMSLRKNKSKDKIILPQLATNPKDSSRIVTDRRASKNHSTIEPVKTSLRKQLEMIYIDRKRLRQSKQKELKKSRSIEKMRKNSENSTIVNEVWEKSRAKGTKIISQTSPNLNSIGPTSNRQSTSIPEPLSIKNSLLLINQATNPASEPSDSQQQQIPLAYYQRQFKQKIAAQCVEQINYLYFSKNESIKDWSEALLAMFEKHDKQIVGLRKKMKYLEKFDDKFFAADIYKNQ